MYPAQYSQNLPNKEVEKFYDTYLKSNQVATINIKDEKASLSFFNFFKANLFNDVLFIYLLCTLPFHSNDFVKDKTTIKTI